LTAVLPTENNLREETIPVASARRDYWTQSLRAKMPTSSILAPQAAVNGSYLMAVSEVRNFMKLDNSYFEPDGMTMMTHRSFGHQIH